MPWSTQTRIVHLTYPFGIILMTWLDPCPSMLTQIAYPIRHPRHQAYVPYTSSNTAGRIVDMWSYSHDEFLSLEPYQGFHVTSIKSRRTCISSHMEAVLSDNEYLNLASNDAWLDSIDPSLVHLSERLNEVRQRSSFYAQVKTVYDHMEIPARRTFVSDKRHIKATVEMLSDKFGISVPRAQRTLRVTTQRGVRSDILPISRWHTRSDRMFSVNDSTASLQPTPHSGRWSRCAATLFPNCTPTSASSRHATHYKGLTATVCCVGNTLIQFISDYGGPERLTFEGASVQTGPKTRFMHGCNPTIRGEISRLWTKKAKQESGRARNSRTQEKVVVPTDTQKGSACPTVLRLWLHVGMMWDWQHLFKYVQIGWRSDTKEYHWWWNPWQFWVPQSRLFRLSALSE